MKVPYVDLGAQYEGHRNEILDAVDRLLTSGQYILGDELANFEDKFAKLCDIKHAIGVADGTAALSLSMKALGIGEGDEVITAPNSFFSTASSIVHTGATPVFADVKEDQNIDPERVIEKITDRTKAIIPVHLTGKIADMNSILEIANKNNIAVIEDAAQAVGASYHGKKAGSMGVTGCFSLHPLKNLNGAGDGGMITTNDDKVAERLRRLRNHGMVDRDTIPEIGWNSRLDSLQATILNVKIKYLDQVTKKRRANADIYREYLSDVVFCPEDEENCFDVYHLFVIQCEKRDELKEYLLKNEIQTSIHYPTPIHLYECLQRLGYKKGDFPNTETQAKRILSLPAHQSLSSEQVEHTCKIIRKFYE